MLLSSNRNMVTRVEFYCETNTYFHSFFFFFVIQRYYIQISLDQLRDRIHLCLSHINNTANTIALLHVIEGGSNVIERLAVGNELIDL